MNTQSDAIHESPLESHTVAVISPGRRMLWSVRREFWENRSLYLAPLAVAALFIVGYLISTLRLVSKIHAGLVLDPLATARGPAAALHLRCAFYHGDDIYRLLLLLSRCVVRRTSRSQHPVLEVPAGFRPHHRAFQGQHSRSWFFPCLLLPSP